MAERGEKLNRLAERTRGMQQVGRLDCRVIGVGCVIDWWIDGPTD